VMCSGWIGGDQLEANVKRLRRAKPFDVRIHSSAFGIATNFGRPNIPFS